MNKKILIATPLYPPESGGPATYAKLIEKELTARGFVVQVLPFSTVAHLPFGVRHVVYFFKVLFSAAWTVYALDPVSVGFPAALASSMVGKKFLLRVPGDYAWEQGQQRFGVKESLDFFQTKRYGFPLL
ncbi:hypothetical protein KW798_03930, partial [Candidatus Parcubacteria bacterium]|nr:hypothetical protein [Candidatus Parcubacteria bacterium]